MYCMSKEGPSINECLSMSCLCIQPNRSNCQLAGILEDFAAVCQVHPLDTENQRQLVLQEIWSKIQTTSKY